jgi:hypothetical protein
VGAGDAGDAAASARAKMMLPTAKTFSVEVAVANADATIQVLSGAGHVKECPVLRMLRDPRDSRSTKVRRQSRASTSCNAAFRAKEAIGSSRISSTISRRNPRPRNSRRWSRRLHAPRPER